MNIVVCGFGRAAKALIEKIGTLENDKLIMVLCRKDSNNANKRLSEYYDNISEEDNVFIMQIDQAKKELQSKQIDVVVDFSHRDMAFPLIELCGEIKANLVICTTNHSIDEISQFERFAEKYQIGIAYCPNLTVGINLLMDFTKKISCVCEDFKFEIIEKHPSDKKKPTATARIIAQTLNRDEVPIHSVRMDGYVGVHQVIGTDETERITITHESLSRQAFANGAIIAANFLYQKSGLYLMKDIIEDLEKRAIETGGVIPYNRAAGDSDYGRRYTA